MSGEMGSVGKSVSLDWSADRPDSTPEADNVAEKNAFGTRETKEETQNNGNFLPSSDSSGGKTLLQRTSSSVNPVSYVNQRSNSADSGVGGLGAEDPSVQAFVEKINDASNMKELEELYTELREDMLNILSADDVQRYEGELERLAALTLSSDISRAQSPQDLIDLNDKIDSLNEILGQDSDRLKDQLELKHFDVMMLELSNEEGVSPGKLDKFFENFAVIEDRLEQDQRQSLKTAICDEMRKQDPGVGESPEKALELRASTERSHSVEELENLMEQLQDDRAEYSDELALMLKDSIYEKLVDIVQVEMDRFETLTPEEITDLRDNINIIPNVESRNVAMHRFEQLQNR